MKVTTTETKIAVAENIPNRIVGLKLENKNTKKPTIIVAPVIIMAIIITGATIIVGFFVFLFSNFNPTILFGIFSATAIFVSVVVTFTFLPNAMMLKSK